MTVADIYRFAIDFEAPKSEFEIDHYTVCDSGTNARQWTFPASDFEGAVRKYLDRGLAQATLSAFASQVFDGIDEFECVVYISRFDPESKTWGEWRN